MCIKYLDRCHKYLNIIPKYLIMCQRGQATPMFVLSTRAFSVSHCCIGPHTQELYTAHSCIICLSSSFNINSMVSKFMLMKGLECMRQTF